MNYGELEVLHHKVLTKTAVDFKFDELQGLKLFPEEPIDGITAKWDILSPSREKGAFRIPGEPATRVELSKVATRYATCILMLLEKCLDMGNAGESQRQWPGPRQQRGLPDEYL